MREPGDPLPANGDHAVEDGTTLRVSPKLFEALLAWERRNTAVPPSWPSDSSSH